MNSKWLILLGFLCLFICTFKHLYLGNHSEIDIYSYEFFYSDLCYHVPTQWPLFWFTLQITVPAEILDIIFIFWIIPYFRNLW